MDEEEKKIMRIITISREFGSGGRELGKRLAEALGIPCYDKQIITEVAKLQGVSEERVQRISQAEIRQVYPRTIGRSFMMPAYHHNQAVQFLVSQHEVIRKLALEGDCVVVGQNADEILKDANPMNIFVHATERAKLRRCMEHLQPGETEKSILAQMKKIDRTRAANRLMITGKDWGLPEYYHLCINTSDMKIEAMVPALAAYVNMWFEQHP